MSYLNPRVEWLLRPGRCPKPDLLHAAPKPTAAGSTTDHRLGFLEAFRTFWVTPQLQLLALVKDVGAHVFALG